MKKRKPKVVKMGCKKLGNISRKKAHVKKAKGRQINMNSIRKKIQRKQNKNKSYDKMKILTTAKSCYIR